MEKDRRFIPLLEELAGHVGGRLTVIEADALGLGAETLPAGAPIVANLPYNVATPLLIGWLTGPLKPRCMTLMFQKEVAERLAAAPGSKDYGRLSVLAQALCMAEVVMSLPARAFTPPPKVDSAVVQFAPRADAPPADRVELLQRLTAAAFGQRRKMLRSSLKSLGGETLLAKAGIDGSRRAEELTVAEFLALTAAYQGSASPA